MSHKTNASQPSRFTPATMHPPAAAPRSRANHPPLHSSASSIDSVDSRGVDALSIRTSASGEELRTGSRHSAARALALGPRAPQAAQHTLRAYDRLHQAGGAQQIVARLHQDLREASPVYDAQNWVRDWDDPATQAALSRVTDVFCKLHGPALTAVEAAYEGTSVNGSTVTAPQARQAATVSQSTWAIGTGGAASTTASTTESTSVAAIVRALTTPLWHGASAAGNAIRRLCGFRGGPTCGDLVADLRRALPYDLAEGCVQALAKSRLQSAHIDSFDNDWQPLDHSGVHPGLLAGLAKLLRARRGQMRPQDRSIPTAVTWNNAMHELRGRDCRDFVVDMYGKASDSITLNFVCGPQDEVMQDVVDALDTNPNGSPANHVFAFDRHGSHLEMPHLPKWLQHDPTGIAHMLGGNQWALDQLREQAQVHLCGGVRAFFSSVLGLNQEGRGVLHHKIFMFRDAHTHEWVVAIGSWCLEDDYVRSRAYQAAHDAWLQACAQAQMAGRELPPEPPVPATDTAEYADSLTVLRGDMAAQVRNIALTYLMAQGVKLKPELSDAQFLRHYHGEQYLKGVDVATIADPKDAVGVVGAIGHNIAWKIRNNLEDWLAGLCHAAVAIRDRFLRHVAANQKNPGPDVSHMLFEVAYLAHTPTVDALVEVARAGIELHVLLPRDSDTMGMTNIQRRGLRRLIEAGAKVKLFAGNINLSAGADRSDDRVGYSHIKNAAVFLTDGRVLVWRASGNMEVCSTNFTDDIVLLASFNPASLAAPSFAATGTRQSARTTTTTTTTAKAKAKAKAEDERTVHWADTSPVDTARFNEGAILAPLPAHPWSLSALWPDSKNRGKQEETQEDLYLDWLFGLAPDDALSSPATPTTVTIHAPWPGAHTVSASRARSPSPASRMTRSAPQLGRSACRRRRRELHASAQGVVALSAKSCPAFPKMTGLLPYDFDEPRATPLTANANHGQVRWYDRCAQAFFDSVRWAIEWLPGPREKAALPDGLFPVELETAVKAHARARRGTLRGPETM